MTQLPPDDGSWLKNLKAAVDPTVFKNGREDAESRRVSGLGRTEVGITATVTSADGNQKHTVQVAPDGAGGLESMCNCAEWKEGAHCRHVVATVLVYLARVRARGDAAPAPTAAPEAEPVLLPALAKLEK